VQQLFHGPALYGSAHPGILPAMGRIFEVRKHAINMPKEKVEAAIKRASGQNATDFQQVLYAGYDPDKLEQDDDVQKVYHTLA
jgi:transcriptional/translational regulatory protein YebC/TACO1